VDTSTWMFGKVPIIPAGSFLSKIRDTTADTCHIQPVTNKDLDLCQELFCIYRQWRNKEGAKGVHLPRSQNFGGAKLRLQRYVIITK